jgi:LacI family transcriptional regulator
MAKRWPPVSKTRRRGQELGRAAASLSQVAAKAGVSIATASRVINGVANKASATTAARVHKVVTELGYRPVSVGRALRHGRSRLVALLAANLANPAMAATAASVEAALRAEALVMVLCDTHERPEIQDEYLLEMRAQFARAIVLLGAVASPQLAAMHVARETLLFVNRRSPHLPKAPLVGIDNEAAGRDVAAFFLRHRLLVAGVIVGSPDSSATADRVRAFRAQLAAASYYLPTGCVHSEPSERDHVAIGYRAIDPLLSRCRVRPCGIFCLSDLIAYGAQRRLAELGVTVPAEVALVGFDDNPLNDFVAPWLSSVRVPYDAFGEAVVRALHVLWRGEMPAATVLPHRLVVRGLNDT